MSQQKPKISVVLVASAGVRSIEKIVSRLRAQTLAHSIELILSARPSCMGELCSLSPDGLHSIQVVEADFSTSARARVPAILAAHAEIIQFCEDHCFPTSNDWAERMLAFHEQGYAVVGPMVANANPMADRTANQKQSQLPFITGRVAMWSERVDRKDYCGDLALGNNLRVSVTTIAIRTCVRCCCCRSIVG